MTLQADPKHANSTSGSYTTKDWHEVTAGWTFVPYHAEGQASAQFVVDGQLSRLGPIPAKTEPAKQ